MYFAKILLPFYDYIKLLFHQKLSWFYCTVFENGYISKSRNKATSYFEAATYM